MSLAPGAMYIVVSGSRTLAGDPLGPVCLRVGLHGLDFFVRYIPRLLDQAREFGGLINLGLLDCGAPCKVGCAVKGIFFHGKHWLFSVNCAALAFL